MTREEFDRFCQTLKATTHVVQWHVTSVWKVGGKIFALAPLCQDDEAQSFCFKCSDLSYDILTQHPGIIPSPYLARAKWIQVLGPDAMTDDDLKDYLKTAHEIVADKLTRKMKKELGLD